MGRKGGGRAAFMKAAQAKNLDGSSSDEEIEEKKDSTCENVLDRSVNPTKLEEDSEVFTPTESETKGQMTQRHKREMKALKDKVKRMGKKGKEEGAKLLKEMEERHEKETKCFEEGETVEQVTVSLYSTDLGEQRKTKAQKRREKMMNDELERERRIAEENEAMGETEREAEEKALEGKLMLSGLMIKDIPSDGHCLYRAIADQIQSLPDNGSQIAAIIGIESKELNFLELRRICADCLRSHKDQFIDFVTGSDLTEQKDCSPDDVYEAYCSEIEGTAAWGGQLEIQALSMALHVHVRIHTVGMDTIDIGSEYAGSLSSLDICYMKHAFGLGEHYQSTTDVEVESYWKTELKHSLKVRSIKSGSSGTEDYVAVPSRKISAKERESKERLQRLVDMHAPSKKHGRK